MQISGAHEWSWKESNLKIGVEEGLWKHHLIEVMPFFLERMKENGGRITEDLFVDILETRPHGEVEVQRNPDGTLSFSKKELEEWWERICKLKENQCET